MAETVTAQQIFLNVLPHKKFLLIVTGNQWVCTSIVLVFLPHVGTLRNRQLTVYWQYRI